MFPFLCAQTLFNPNEIVPFWAQHTTHSLLKHVPFRAHFAEY